MTNTSHESATISVVVSRPDSSVFWSNIIHEIAKEVTQAGCSLMYTYVPTEIPKDYILPPPLTSGQVQGIIILNVYNPKGIFGCRNQFFSGYTDWRHASAGGQKLR